METWKPRIRRARSHGWHTAARWRANTTALQCLFVLSWIAPVPLTGAETPNVLPADISALRQRLSDHISQTRFSRARWGICIESLDTGVTLFSCDADKLFLPASNAKLYIAALALDRLGGEHRIQTSLHATARPDRHGVLKGNLIVYGRGDPSISARFHGGDIDRAFVPLAALLARAGVRTVRGDVIADESYFRGPPFGSGWEWDDLQCYYGAEVSALSVNDNAVEVVVQPREKTGLPVAVMVRPHVSFLAVSNNAVTCEPNAKANLRIGRPLSDNTVYVEGCLPVGHTGEVERISVHRPALWFAEMTRKTFERQGIKVTGRTRVIDANARQVWPFEADKLHDLGSVQSPPIRDLVRQMMKPSQNLHAQLLLLQVGAKEEADANSRLSRRSPAGHGNAAVIGTTSETVIHDFGTTETAGLKALETFLRKAGIELDKVHLEEGSGLSRHDLVTPSATVALLRYMEKHPAAADFRDSLPVAGVDGTLRNRMKTTVAASNARAKTGMLSYVYTLSGYVTSAAGERFVFSIMLNNYRAPDSARPARAELDDIVVLLAGLQSRTAAP